MTGINSVFAAIVDTYVRQLEDKEVQAARDDYCRSIAKELQVSPEAHCAFLKFKGSDIDHIGKMMHEYLLEVAPCDKLTSLMLVVRMLSTAVGTTIICGMGFKRFASFPKLDHEDRTKALKKLESSWIPDLRQLYRVFYGVSMLHAYGLDLKDKLNVTWQALNYKGPETVKDRFEHFPRMWHPVFLDVGLLAKQSPANEVELFYDIVIVGSGPGGAVMASELTKDGHRVLVVDKGSYITPELMPLTEKEAFRIGYEKGAGMYSEDFALQILAGATWGGGSAVNWSASFQPPDKLRAEWARKYGLEFFATPEFQRNVEIVWERLGISDKVEHNVPNSLFLEGCKRLGIDGRLIMQNTRGQAHNCGHCTFGCPYQTKQSSAITFLKDAADRGCHFIDGFEVDRVLHKSQIAKGVEGHKGDIPVKVHSKYVVLSCGSISTPALLLRSHIQGLNRNVGKHLKLHPVTLAYGVFRDKNVMPSKGSIMTTVSDVVADLDSKGYGAKLEIPASHPAMFASTIPWDNAQLHKKRMMEWPHTTSVIVLTRDKDSEGTIWVDSDGKPRFDWKIGSFDAKSMEKGLEAAIRILLAAGAHEVFTSQVELPYGYQRDPSQSVDEVLQSRSFRNYISQVLKLGIKPSRANLFSAHQMGSCRMSKSPNDGAVDPHGRLWGFRNLYISDTSVFPTASGVK
jgi:choline dehydrogenase-like flavoprotein